MTYDPFPTLIWALQCVCTVEALEHPSGSSPFADDMALHSDGPDAIPAIHVMFNASGAYLQWLGLFVNMQKSNVCAVNLADGLPVATDSIGAYLLCQHAKVKRMRSQSRRWSACGH